MEQPEDTTLWQALHTAYEERNPQEARRLLNNGAIPGNCCFLQRCSDIDYLRWLLDNKLIVPSSDTPRETWPERQEKQLQCDALPEAERPHCIIDGEWEKPPAI